MSLDSKEVLKRPVSRFANTPSLEEQRKAAADAWDYAELTLGDLYPNGYPDEKGFERSLALQARCERLGVSMSRSAMFVRLKAAGEHERAKRYDCRRAPGSNPVLDTMDQVDRERGLLPMRRREDSGIT